MGHSGRRPEATVQMENENSKDVTPEVSWGWPY